MASGAVAATTSSSSSSSSSSNNTRGTAAVSPQVTGLPSGSGCSASLPTPADSTPPASGSAPASTLAPAPAPIKRRRATQACDYCSRRSIKCSFFDGACQHCRDFGQPCTFLRKPRRRGVPPRSAQPAAAGSAPVPGPATEALEPSSVASVGRQRAIPYRGPRDVKQENLDASSAWHPPLIASQATVVDLVDLYFEIVYPIFPFFHQPSFVRRISRADYMTDRCLFASTMAVCALVSGRIRDGSVTNPRWDLNPLRHPPPQVFYAEAQRQLVEIGSEASLHVLRAHAILAIAAIQNGHIRDMHYHLGTYHTLVAMDALHDEANWPPNIGLVEREERRRLFWSIYTLDVYTSVVWGGILRSREQQSSVAYPLEIDDDLIMDDTHHGGQSPTSASSSSTCRVLLDKSQSWMKGWNFITDLYRVLEHALTRFRSHSNRSRRQSLILHEIFDDEKSNVTEASVRDRVLQLYLDLPSCFRETPELTYVAKKDLFGYQAANIKASLQLVRMVLFAAAGASIEERCQIVREVLNAFVSVPVAYLVAISTPLLHHLGGIGALLGSVLEEPLSQQDYSQVRSLLLSMAQLLESLEAIRHSASASEKLRLQVSRIDEYMAAQRHVVPPLDLHNGAEAFMPPGATGPSTSASIPLQQPQQQPHHPQQPQTTSDMPDSWSFQVPAELLGGLSWEF